MTVTRRIALGAPTLAAAAIVTRSTALAQSPVRLKGNGALGRLVTAQSTDGLSLSGAMFGPEGAPEILFLHGLGQSRLAWERQIEALSSDFRIAAFDLRGHGDSAKPDDPQVYADGDRWGDDIAAMIEAGGLRRPTLVGWSFGGLTAGHYLRRHGGGGLNGMILACPVTRFAPELLGEAALAVGPGLVSDNLDERAEAIVRTVLATFAHTLPDATFNRMLAVNGMAPVALQKGYGLVDNSGIDAAWASTERLLVIHGARDRITRPEMSRRLLDLNPAARLVSFQASGHAPQYDNTARFNRLLSEFAGAPAPRSQPM